MSGVIEAANGQHWAIGALARACGITVRALHHYDRIGLLAPEARTRSGHRRYTDRDLHRLYQIRALQGLGLSLEQIAVVLADQDDGRDSMATLRDVLATQLRGLDEQATRLAEIRGRISGLLRQVDADQLPDPHHFMATLELMSMYETYFTPQQRDQLAERRAELGPEAVQAAQQEWADLVEALLPHVAADTPVDDPQVAELIVRWRALGARFHSAGQPGQDTADVARRMWRDNSAELGARLPWPTDSVIALVKYVERAAT
ncbi:MAG TPA: MerR family transcriptional regulator [Pseudonocardiaceae bacterium]|nr:MerR family transcriptional regulator [Pseudonocardiaceae bacterium]